MEKVIGDETAVAELRAMVKENREYLKFLVSEARSNSDHTTSFRGKDGDRYSLKLNLATGQMTVSRVEDG